MGRFWIVWAALLAVLSLVLSTGSSRWIEERAPGIALRLNPLNAQARVNLLVSALNEPDDPLPTQAVKTALAGFSTEPLDARFHSILGELRLREGHEAEARSLFETANALSPTEIHALRHLLQRAVEEGRSRQAIGHLDTLLRRWPGETDAFLPLLQGLIAGEEAYLGVRDAMRANTPWRGAVLASLSRGQDGVELAYRLLLDLTNTEHPPRPGEIASATRGLVAAGRPEDAYRLFRFTLPESERERMGFVHNAALLPSEAAGPFTWGHRSTRAAGIHLSGEASSSGAIVRFQNAPAREIVLHQTLLLPPGRYRLLAEVDAAGLDTPRSLYWRLSCLEPRGELARLLIPEGSYRSRRLEAVFETGDCALQRLQLDTDVVAESWRNRYGGQVRLRSVNVERIGFADTEG